MKEKDGTVPKNVWRQYWCCH